MAKNTESEMSNLHPLRVLMVEDSEDDALLVLRELKKGGYNPEYERVETAAAMRKALQDKTWDVILCDYQLPSFNGIEAIAVLKENKYRYSYHNGIRRYWRRNGSGMHAVGRP